MSRIKIIVIGGGFGGLYAIKALRSLDADITLIDQRNFHLFQPLLYQVATGGLSPADIAFPLRAILKRQKNTTVLLGKIIDIDFPNRQVHTVDSAIPFDYLVIATGSYHHYFGNDQWQMLAPGLKTIEDATNIRSRILSAFEMAESVKDIEKRNAMLTFAVVGGGPAGVEMAGAIAELSRHTLIHNFRHINPGDARILLIEGANRILPPYPEGLSQIAEKTLRHLGVEVMTNTVVRDIAADRIRLKSLQGEKEIYSNTVIWAAGVKASSMSEILKNKLGTETDKSGRILVNNRCSLDSVENMFVIGDLAHFKNEGGMPLPGVATVAMQQGRYVARLISARIKGRTCEPFRYLDKGSLAVIGRKSAVAFRKSLQISGFFAWILWLIVHLMYLVGFENRVLVFIQWAFNYITFNHSARLITGNKTD